MQAGTCSQPGIWLADTITPLFTPDLPRNITEIYSQMLLQKEEEKIEKKEGNARRHFYERKGGCDVSLSWLW